MRAHSNNCGRVLVGRVLVVADTGMNVLPLTTLSNLKLFGNQMCLRPL
jgi:hypothetical protein